MRVLISGAGVAGPALAWWLTRRGSDVVVVERTPELRFGGHAIDIRGVAVDVVERMGLLEKVRAARTQLATLSIVRKPGKRTLDIAIPRMEQPDHRDVEIVRDDLVRILYEASRDDAEYVFGDSIESIEDAGSELRVRFASGAARSFDAVVGADGQHSATRRIVFGDESAFTRRIGAFIAIFGVPNLLGLEDRVMLYNEPGLGAAFYTMAGNERAKVVMLFRSDASLDIARDEPAQKQLLRERFRDVGWETRRFLDALDGASDFYFDEIAQIHMPAWSKGRVCLLGDAAYGPSPLTGQGTTLALVGAHVLADAIATYGEPAPAFAAYERSMRSFVDQNQRIANAGLGMLVPGSPLTIGVRNAVIRALPLLLKLGIRVDRQLAKASTAIELPAERAVGVS